MSPSNNFGTRPNWLHGHFAEEPTDAQEQVHLEQIAQTLTQVDVGRLVNDICWELGISVATHYIRKSNCGGLDWATGSDVRKGGNDAFLRIRPRRTRHPI